MPSLIHLSQIKEGKELENRVKALEEQIALIQGGGGGTTDGGTFSSVDGGSFTEPDALDGGGF